MGGLKLQWSGSKYWMTIGRMDMDCVLDVVGQMLTHSPSSLQFLREAFRRHTIPQCSAGSKAVRAAFNNIRLFCWSKNKQTLEPSHT